MKQYMKNYELKNLAKDRLEGRYGGAIRVLCLSYLISWLTRLVINNVAGNTMASVYSMTSSRNAAIAVSVFFNGLLLLATVILGVMNAGITLYFLNLASGQQPVVKDLFYGFRNDSKKALGISAALTLCHAVCLWPSQYLFQHFLEAQEARWIMYALIALAIGLCVYVPISLGISLSFYLMLDFPQNSGKETLKLCWRLMLGNRKRLFLLELGFLPLLLLCLLSFGIGFLWLEPYMHMTYTCFFLDMMNPKN